MCRYEKPKGVHIEVNHFRRFASYFGDDFYYADYPDEFGELQPRGGITVADIFDSKGHLLVSASANCSTQDNYCKRIGKDIAVGRALKELYEGFASGLIEAA